MKETNVDEKYIETELKPHLPKIRVDFQPGDDVLEGKIKALWKIGSGKEAHQYVVLSATDPKISLDSAYRASAPYATYKHFIGLFKQAKERAEMNSNDYGEEIQLYKKILEGADGKSGLIGKQKNTRPLHNNQELQQMINSIFIGMYALKWNGSDMIQNDPEKEAGFVNEHAILSSLTHQNIPKANGSLIRTEKGIGYLVDYRDAKPLDAIISDDWWRKVKANTEERIPEKVIDAIMWQYYDALQYMEEIGHVRWHDLKLGNILLGVNDGLISLIDFGFSEKMMPGKKVLEITGGNVDMMPPEDLDSIEEVDENGYGYRIKQGHQIMINRTQLTWGASLLHYILESHGNHPFNDPKFNVFVHNAKTKEETPVSFYNPACDKKKAEKLIKRGLRKKPEERPDINEQKKEIEKYLDEPSQDILRKWMKQLEDQRARSYVDPQAPILMTPPVKKSGRESTKFKKPSAKA